VANTYISKDLPPALVAALERIFVRMSPTQLPSARLHATKRVAFRHATFARFAYSSDQGPLPWEHGSKRP
jgi:hypothetical protein